MAYNSKSNKKKDQEYDLDKNDLTYDLDKTQYITEFDENLDVFMDPSVLESIPELKVDDISIPVGNSMDYFKTQPKKDKLTDLSVDEIKKTFDKLDPGKDPLYDLDKTKYITEPLEGLDAFMDVSKLESIPELKVDDISIPVGNSMDYFKEEPKKVGPKTELKKDNETDLAAASIKDGIKSISEKFNKKNNHYVNLSNKKGTNNLFICSTKQEALDLVKQFAEEYDVKFDLGKSGKLITNDEHNINVSWICDDAKDLDKSMEKLIKDDKAYKKFMLPYDLKAGVCMVAAIAGASLESQALANIMVMLLQLTIEKAEKRFKEKDFSFTNCAPEAAKRVMKDMAKDKDIPEIKRSNYRMPKTEIGADKGLVIDKINKEKGKMANKSQVKEERKSKGRKEIKKNGPTKEDTKEDVKEKPIVEEVEIIVEEVLFMTESMDGPELELDRKR